jgi:hypothetical protein
MTIVFSSSCTSVYERNIPAMGINRPTVTVELNVTDISTYTNDLRLTCFLPLL